MVLHCLKEGLFFHNDLILKISFHADQIKDKDVNLAIQYLLMRYESMFSLHLSVFWVIQY